MKKFLYAAMALLLGCAGMQAQEVTADEAAFQQLNAQSGLPEYYQFLELYPKSPRAKEVSDSVAILLARSFSTPPTENQKRLALSYARDRATRQRVKAMAEQGHTAAWRQEHPERQHRDTKWGISVALPDYTFNLGDNEYDYMDIMAGVAARYGQFRDRFNLEAGVMLGMFLHRWKGKELNDFKTQAYQNNFQIPLFLRGKLYICDLGQKARLYADGRIYFNPMHKTQYKQKLFAGAIGLGVGLEKMELSIYYKNQIGNTDIDQIYISTDNMGGGYLPAKAKNRYHSLGISLFWNFRL
ncbi:MAG: hypothetical protein LUC85_06460 [Bacteroidales bacterium]|nr:hypothetical protein [Bacteroidales bacterium]MCD8394461.1 hypothetical protein [Bacteroidales bacterium]